MKLICLKNDLVKSINIVSKAVPTRSSMTILESIYIDAQADQIRMTGNDMDLGIETITEGTIEERGTVAVNARFFADIIRKLPDGEVTIQADENGSTMITCGKAKFQISGDSGEEFPAIPMIERNHSVRISQLTLRTLIQQTVFAISQNDTNKIMTGELMEIRGDHLRLVALDGHRVAVRNTQLAEGYLPMNEDALPGSEAGSIRVIIPGKTLLEISRIMTDDVENMVTLSFTQNHVMFEFDQTTVVSRLIEGRYFEIDNMISNDYETKVIINRRELIECLDRSLLMVREDDKKPIILNMEGQELQLKISTQIGSMDETMPISMEGRELKIGFNPKYVLDALRVITDEDICIYFVNSRSPGFIRDDEGSYVYLVLPVNFVG